MAIKDLKLKSVNAHTIALDKLIQRSQIAKQQFQDFTQEQIDHIVQQMALAGTKRHMELAKLAIEETGKGVYEDKILKNLYSLESTFHHLKYVKTVGEIQNNPYETFKTFAEPVGTIAATVPDSAPTSTVFFKCLIAIKTKNPIIFCFHPNAYNSSKQAALCMMDAAILAGAPPYCIQWLESEELEFKSKLLEQNEISVILATGDVEAVEQGQMLGKPVLSIVTGNVPCFIDRTANLKQAVTDLLLSKNFDNGMSYHAEQTLIAERAIHPYLKNMLLALGCYFLNDTEVNALMEQIWDASSHQMKECFIGQSAHVLGRAAGIDVPVDTKLLIIEHRNFDPSSPFLYLNGGTVLSLYTADDSEDGIEIAKQVASGKYSTSAAVIHSQNEQTMELFAQSLHSHRIVVNSPATQGMLDEIYHLGQNLASIGNGAFSNSLQPQSDSIPLLRLKKVTKRSVQMQWFKIPPKIYFAKGSTKYLTKMPHISRVYIVTDQNMVKLGHIDTVKYYLNQRSTAVQIEVFNQVTSDPSLETVMKGVAQMQAFQPDCIIAVGGGSSMDAAKAMWLFYEHPETDFEAVKTKFIHIRNRVYKYPRLGIKAQLVAIPTTSGTGSEVTSFATITETSKGTSKYPLADYELTPNVAIIDSDFVNTLPSHVIADTGMDVLTHAIEAYVSVMANDFTDGLAIKAIQLVFDHLEKSFASGDATAREKMHNASTIAGMAFSNAYLGICHSLAHKFGAEFHLSHGRVNAILLPHVIRYNSQCPSKFQAFSNYDHFQADIRYAEISRILGLSTSHSTNDGVQGLITAIRRLNQSLGIPESFEAAGISAIEFESKVDYLAERAFEDQYTNSNPRLPLISELAQIYRNAFYGHF